MRKENPIGVSTATFIDIKPLEVPILAIAKATGNLYAPEIGQAIKVAKEFDTGLELVYRNGNQARFEKWDENNPTILQIHGPIFHNLADAAAQGFKDNSKLA